MFLTISQAEAIQFICAQAFMNTLTSNGDHVLLDDRFLSGAPISLPPKTKQLIDKLYQQTLQIEIKKSIFHAIGQNPTAIKSNHVSNFYEMLMK